MAKKGFTIIEVAVVFCLLLAVAFFILPTSLDTTRQARLISKWTKKYADLEYMFHVINVVQTNEIKKEFSKEKNLRTEENTIPDLFKPYLRVTSEYTNTDYQPKYMDNTLINDGDKYFIKKHYLTDDKELVGLKWTQNTCRKDSCAIMSFDINGPKSPNTWGIDIFGIDVYKDKIAPIGKNQNYETLKNDCSKHGFGIYCSNYYLIGGKFD